MATLPTMVQSGDWAELLRNWDALRVSGALAAHLEQVSQRASEIEARVYHAADRIWIGQSAQTVEWSVPGDPWLFQSTELEFEVEPDILAITREVVRGGD